MQTADRCPHRGCLGVADLDRQLRLRPPFGVVVAEHLQDDGPSRIGSSSDENCLGSLGMGADTSCVGPWAVSAVPGPLLY